MKWETLVELNRLDVIRLCHSALDSRTLRNELLRRLQAVIPFDYAYFSTTDPATQLGSSSVLIKEPPEWCMPFYVENEFLQDDFIKFSAMQRSQQFTGILSEATGHQLHRSQRYREMLAPMSMGDELRAIFVADTACWGTLCLHREAAKTGYTPAEAAALAQVIPHIADGLRKALILSRVSSTTTPYGPGVMILTDDSLVIATTAAAEYWLAELSEAERADRGVMPAAVRSVIGQLKAIERGQAPVGATPKVRLHTRSGHWIVLYASRLRGPDGQTQISVVFDVAQPAEIAPLIMQAYELTKREGEVTQCVLRGWSTHEIAARLHISQHTVQDHLKAVFEKVSVGSRGELAARIFLQQHQP